MFNKTPINHGGGAGRGRGRAAIAASAGVVLLVAGVVPAYAQDHEEAHNAAHTGGAVQPYTAPPLTWATCRPAMPGGKQLSARFECARLTVPLDYSMTGGETIQLALVRIKATDQAHRIGSLVLNFGGPGGSGVQILSSGISPKLAKLGTRYDLVSFDPRGVGESAPVTCMDAAQRQKSMLSVDLNMDSAQERAAAAALMRAVAESCQKQSGKLLPYVGTVNAARDLEVLRGALGDEKLNYFGFSYGTQLGGNYAHQFPDRVGRMVLDGAVNPRLDRTQSTLEQAAGFQAALGDFADWAGRQPQARELKGTRDQALSKITTVFGGLENNPVRLTNVVFTQRMLGTVLADALYSKKSWPKLLKVIEAVAAGDGRRLTAVLTAAANAGGQDDALSPFAHIAIECADYSQRPTEQDVKNLLPKFKSASPIFASLAEGLLSCTGWPVKGDDAGHQASAPGAPPILVVGNTGDPATPYAWAPALAKELGSGVLLTLQGGEGHASYPTGDMCIRTNVNEYLLNGTVPANGTICTAPQVTGMTPPVNGAPPS